MLSYKKLNIESKILGKKIVQLFFERDKSFNFYEIEEKIKGIEKADYVQVIIDIRDINIIQYFEIQGFRFSEFRINRYCDLSKTIIDNNTNDEKNYSISIVNNECDLNLILNIAQNELYEDRFSVDPLFSRELSVKRNLAFIKKSYNNNNEFLLKVVDNVENIVGFQNGAFINENKIQLYLNKIYKKYSTLENEVIIDKLVLNYFKKLNYKYCYAVSSAQNIQEINRSLVEIKFKIESSLVVLRKIYEYD